MATRTKFFSLRSHRCQSLTEHQAFFKKFDYFLTNNQKAVPHRTERRS